MRFLARHRMSLASAAVLVVGAASLVAYALSSNGYPVRQVDLNDGGIWVTSDRDGLFGRLNKPAGSLDAAFYPPGGAQQAYQLDISQDAAAVVARDRASGKLFPVDVIRGVTMADQGVALPATAQVQLAGGTLAVLDPKSGKLWASRVDGAGGVTGLSPVGSSSAPLATVDGSDRPDGAALAVAVDGTVFAVSATGKTVSVHPDGGGFGQPGYGRFTGQFTAVRATAVGSTLVMLDDKGTLVLPGGRTVRAPDGDHAVLQQPGPDAGAVVVATTKGLFAVSLSSGELTTLFRADGGNPAAPVRLGNCVHAAWAGETGGYVRSCGGQQATPGNLKDLRALVDPRFRVNRGLIVLNDLANGAVWDLTSQRKVDDWTAVKPPPVEKPADKSKDDKSTEAARDKPPKAVDDTLGARSGRTTVLNVLDNDSDPAGNILSISAVTAPDNPAAGVAVAPNGQTVQVTLPEQSLDVHFKYTVDDGKGLNATAAVTVQVRSANENKPPELRPGFTPRPWSMPSGGRISLPVLGDWRDFDGDPVVLADAMVKAGSVTTTPAGFVDYTAPMQPGEQSVGYRVTDGRAEPVGAAESVTVQPATATAGVAATAQPDVARGQVGQPIAVRPLDNDLPGSDPTNPTARLQLAAELASPAGTVVSTDVKTGRVTVTASRPGTFLLDYTVAFGNAPFAKSVVRVDVSAAPASPLPPVAVPDAAVVRGQLPSTVDVLANDVAPSGGMLVVQQAVPVLTGAPVQVAVVKGRWLRINTLSPAISPNQQVVRYTVTDGVTGPVTGEVTVTQLAAPEHDVPVPRDDYAVVRAGDTSPFPCWTTTPLPAGHRSRCPPTFRVPLSAVDSLSPRCRTGRT